MGTRFLLLLEACRAEFGRNHGEMHVLCPAAHVDQIDEGQLVLWLKAKARKPAA
jgi:hypothetical protein